MNLCAAKRAARASAYGLRGAKLYFANEALARDEAKSAMVVMEDPELRVPAGDRAPWDLRGGIAFHFVGTVDAHASPQSSASATAPVTKAPMTHTRAPPRRRRSVAHRTRRRVAMD